MIGRTPNKQYVPPSTSGFNNEIYTGTDGNVADDTERGKNMNESVSVTINDEKDSYDCGACARPNTFDNMVECEQCCQWYHYICVGINETIKDKRWKCDKCLNMSRNIQT